MAIRQAVSLRLRDLTIHNECDGRPWRARVFHPLRHHVLEAVRNAAVEVGNRFGRGCGRSVNGNLRSASGRQENRKESQQQRR